MLHKLRMTPMRHTARAAAPPFDGHQHECGPAGLSVGGSPLKALVVGHQSRCGRPRTRHAAARGRRVTHGARRSLWSISHAVSLRLSPSSALQPHRRNPPRVRRHQIRRPEPLGQRQLGVVEDGPRGQRDLVPAARALPPCAGRRAHTRPGPHSAHTRIRPATGSQPDTVGRRLRWRIGAETRADSWGILGGAHAYTTYRRVLKQPEKQKAPRTRHPVECH